MSDERKRLQRQTLLGFLTFFSVMSVIQAALNVVQPEPKMWPAVLALVLVTSTVIVWRRWK
ncbi:hypothetical protein CKALI_09255 [Corynebacterium kalinowskii]|uniref:Uncharacterized protein n=1 Tax=Corynebacterium kalinowskii TaxID=2675216 RepID=A0A6B8VVI8_9CORY|nr:hypothetical protein [Corynebacterium kalinowskii]QGU02706.1 hypothetical protein CKALI_09255 [Corynebacterium kalinowskii]